MNPDFFNPKNIPVELEYKFPISDDIPALTYAPCNKLIFFSADRNTEH